MDSHFSLELQRAFIATEGGVKKLNDLLEDRIGPVEISAECADDVTRKFSSLKELFIYENANDQRIRRLSLSARSKDYTKGGDIDLGGTLFRGITLSFRGRDDVVSRLRSDTLRALEGMAPWYGVLHRVSIFVLLFVAQMALTILLCLGLSILYLLGRVKDSPGLTANDAAHISIINFAIIISIYGAAAALTYFRDSIFPRVVFLIGHGKARFEHLERIQWCVVIAFIVSIVAGLCIEVVQAIHK